jgi:NADPH oxidase
MLQQVELVWVCRDIDSLVWIQDLLVRLQEDVDAEDTFRLRVNIFVTGAVDIEDIHKYVRALRRFANVSYALNSTDAKHDPFSHLVTRLSFGRPNFDQYLSTVAEQVGLGRDSKRQVGLYFCGPKPMTHAIRQACKRQSTDCVQFRFHKENF